MKYFERIGYALPVFVVACIAYCIRFNIDFIIFVPLLVVVSLLFTETYYFMFSAFIFKSKRILCFGALTFGGALLTQTLMGTRHFVSVSELATAPLEVKLSIPPASAFLLSALAGFIGIMLQKIKDQETKRLGHR